MKILGIETSCDETAAAVVEDGKKLLSNVVASSMDLHKQYGGVVPEIAARSHIESINPVIQQALDEAFPDFQGRFLEQWERVDGIAVTYGAGLGGSLLIGVLAARTLAIVKKKPLFAINHVEAHLYVNFLIEQSKNLSYKLRATQPQFPILGLIVSGGHSQLVMFKNHFDYKLLGRTQDDAIGEAFDKVAKIIGLPYPGGPSVSKAAKLGDDQRYKLPKAKMPGYDFSFSGIKTAVLRLAQKEIGEDFTFPSFEIAAKLSEKQRNDIAASFQKVAIETIVDKAVTAYKEFQPKSVIIGGGVSANQELRRQLAKALPIEIEYPDIRLCTDNGAMVATLGCYKASLNQPTADPYSLEIQTNLSM